MQVNIIQFFQNSGVVTSLCVFEKQEQLPSFALKDNGKSQSIPVYLLLYIYILRKVWRNDELSNGGNNHCISQFEQDLDQ